MFFDARTIESYEIAAQPFNAIDPRSFRGIDLTYVRNCELHIER